MRPLLPSVFALVLVFEMLGCRPVRAFVGPTPGVSRSDDASLDGCQKRFAELLRFIHREREYATDKANFQDTMADRCTRQKWYDFSILQCVLFVPVFGLILPFFALMLFGAVRSIRRTSHDKAIE